ncbi:uncharacterized protein LOC142765761 isoform X2 [Rhipicephalus microplus]|uniref:uncharacterized protein LOC142765761 isoform X2 n=1 Tax=Rhipicephalus microplus TaxID=6941 RepID=UPI003F6AEAD6
MDQPLETCTACGSSIPHALTNTTDKLLWGRRHSCNVCDYKTARSSNLKRHCRVHTGERSFKCHLCPQGFSHNSTLKKHLRTHTGERPYKCHLCPEAFSRKSTLNKHLLTHTGE